MIVCDSNTHTTILYANEVDQHPEKHWRTVFIDGKHISNNLRSGILSRCSILEHTDRSKKETFIAITKFQNIYGKTLFQSQANNFSINHLLIIKANYY